MPHHFIFNRYWYDSFGGQAELESYKKTRSKLSESEENELLDFLCGRNKSQYKKDLNQLSTGALRDIATHYVPLPKDEEIKIWASQKIRRQENMKAYLVADDERVEDAILTDEDIQPVTLSSTKKNVQVSAR